MILFDNIVQVLALANLDALVLVSVVLLDGRRIGSAFVDIYQARFAVGADRFVEKTPGRLFITLHSEQEIDSLALLVDGAIEIFPLAFDFDIGLIKPPAIPGPLFAFAKGLLDSRRIMNDPALNGTVINGLASLLHQFLKISVAERIGHVPAHALQNDILLVMAAFKADHLSSDNWRYGQLSIDRPAEPRQPRDRTKYPHQPPSSGIDPG
jgi:hypothetical protein